MKEKCAICGCPLHRKLETYARPTPDGRSHATKHHFVAERFFGRSSNRRGVLRSPIFDTCPWDCEGESETFCYDCHEVILHNPVFLPEDIKQFAQLVGMQGLSETGKTEDQAQVGGRIQLLHDVIARGLEVLLSEESPAHH